MKIKIKNINESIKWYNKGKFIIQDDIKPVETYYDFITNDEFRQFLLDNDCYEQYIENCPIGFMHNFQFENITEYINVAFSWASTKQGKIYWERIDELWRLHCLQMRESIKWYNKGKFNVQDNIEPVEQYDDFITDDEFRQFLIDNDCYDEYIENCTEFFKKHFISYSKENYISAAFTWSSTKKGTFWNKLNVKWLKYSNISELNIDESIKWYNKGKFTVQDNIEHVEQYDDFIKDDEFRQFLIDNDCYYEYIENCSPIFKKDFNKIRKRNYISRAFSWIGSPEGEEYWDDINTKWENYDKTIYNESIKWYNKGKFNVQDNIEPVKQYDDFIKDDEFRQFLIDNDCYYEYIENCTESFKRTFSKSKFDFLLYCFTWIGTPQGGDYWKKIHLKWMDILKKEN